MTRSLTSSNSYRSAIYVSNIFISKYNFYGYDPVEVIKITQYVPAGLVQPSHKPLGSLALVQNEPESWSIESFAVKTTTNHVSLIKMSALNIKRLFIFFFWMNSESESLIWFGKRCIYRVWGINSVGACDQWNKIIEQRKSLSLFYHK